MSLVLARAKHQEWLAGLASGKRPLLVLLLMAALARLQARLQVLAPLLPVSEWRASVRRGSLELVIFSLGLSIELY